MPVTAVPARYRALVVSCLFAAWTATVARGASPPPPTDDWPRAEPASQGLDAAPLGELVAAIEADEFPDLHGLLVVRNGYLVIEEYFDGWSADHLHTLQSVSKSFTSALVGIAIDRGDVRSVDEKVLDFFSGVEPIANLDERKRRMRFRDLLTMRSGTDYHERGSSSPHDRLNSLARGWDRFYLDRPMVAEPGERFQYDSGGVILLSAILERCTGLHADAYAERHLFRRSGSSTGAGFATARAIPTPAAASTCARATWRSSAFSI
jgi:CubicO group peptidase (beta-lactamase class C family)